MDGGNLDEVKQLVVKLAVIAEQIDARSHAALARIEASTTTLDHSAGHWGASADTFSRQALHAIAIEAHDCVADGTRKALAPLEARLKQGADAATWAADALAEQRKLLSREQRGMMRRSLLALLAGSLLVVGAAGYGAWRNAQSAALQNDVGAAVRSGALVRCPGSAALCVRIGSSSRRAGRHGEYLVVGP